MNNSKTKPMMITISDSGRYFMSDKGYLGYIEPRDDMWQNVIAIVRRVAEKTVESGWSKEKVRSTLWIKVRGSQVVVDALKEGRDTVATRWKTTVPTMCGVRSVSAQVDPHRLKRLEVKHDQDLVEFVVNPGGKVYHELDCKHVKGDSIAYYLSDPNPLNPCKICNRQ